MHHAPVIKTACGGNASPALRRRRGRTTRRSRENASPPRQTILREILFVDVFWQCFWPKGFPVFILK
jgi:hypothetical protein